MKLDKRTIEAFVYINEQLKLSGCGKRSYPAEESNPGLGPFKIMITQKHSRSLKKTRCIGYYRTEELLRAGVETVAEFLEEVV